MKAFTLNAPNSVDLRVESEFRQTSLDSLCTGNYGATEDAACDYILSGLAEGDEISFEALTSAVAAIRTMARFSDQLPASVQVLAVFADKVIDMAERGRAREIPAQFGLGRVHRDEVRRSIHIEAAAFYEYLTADGASHQSALNTVAEKYCISESAVKGYVTKARAGDYGALYLISIGLLKENSGNNLSRQI